MNNSQQQASRKVIRTNKGEIVLIENVVLDLMQCFSRSFLNQFGEFIAHDKGNEYFNLAKCKDELEVKCKVLECLSRGASKTQPFGTRKKNEEFNNFMLDGINQFLGTEFTREEMITIYQELGNGINRTLSIEFVKSGFDMKVLTGDDGMDYLRECERTGY